MTPPPRLVLLAAGLIATGTLLSGCSADRGAQAAAPQTSAAQATPSIETSELVAALVSELGVDQSTAQTAVDKALSGISVGNDRRAGAGAAPSGGPQGGGVPSGMPSERLPQGRPSGTPQGVPPSEPAPGGQPSDRPDASPGGGMRIAQQAAASIAGSLGVDQSAVLPLVEAHLTLDPDAFRQQPGGQPS